MATFLSMAQEIAQVFSHVVPTTLANASDPNTINIKNFINNAYNELWLELGAKNPLAQTEVSVTISANTPSVAIPSTLNEVWAVYYNNFTPLIALPWQEFLERKSTGWILTNNIGYPNWYSVYGGSLYLYPAFALGNTLLVRGLKAYTPLTIDSSTPLLPDEFHNAIKFMAMEQLANKNEQNADYYTAKAGYWKKLAMGQINCNYGMPNRIRTKREVTEARSRNLIFGVNNA